MRVEQEPITGNEDLETLSGLHRAVAEFYAACNSRDLRRMARNWADTDDVVMDNPVGGITRGWEGIRAVYADRLRRLVGDCVTRPFAGIAYLVTFSGLSGVGPLRARGPPERAAGSHALAPARSS